MGGTGGDEAPTRQGRARVRWGPLLAVAIVVGGVAATAVSYRAAERGVLAQERGRLRDEVDAAADSVRLAFARAREALDDTADAVRPDFGATRLAEAAGRADITRRVPALTRIQLVGNVRTPDGGRSAPVVADWPGDSGGTVGRDVIAEPGVREAIERSAATGKVVATAPRVLGTGAATSDVTRIFAPVFADAPAGAAGPGALQGWVAATFDGRAFARTATDLPDDIVLELADRTGTRDRPLFISPPDVANTSSYVVETGIEEFGLDWRLRAAPLRPVSSTTAVVPLLIGVGGLLITALMAAVVWVLATSRDRALRRAAASTATLRTSEARFRRLFTEAGVAQILVDRHLVVTDANDACCTLLAAERDDLVGTDVRRALDVADDSPTGVLLQDCARGRSDHAAFAHTITTGDGDTRAIVFDGIVLAGATTDGDVLLAQLQDVTAQRTAEQTLRDAGRELERRVEERTADLELANVRLQHEIAERARFENRLEHLALHDPLTGLPNRALLLDRMQHAIDRARRDGGSLALLFIDLDRFKLVNDSYGHISGDRLLTGVAERLSAAVRATDTVARLGGDEFAVLCEDAGEDEAVAAAERIQQSLRSQFVLPEGEVFSAASIGIVVSDGVDTASDDLLRDADTAMYRAKERGRGRWEVFDDTLRELSVHRLRTEASLRRALDRGELVVHYQPQVLVDDGTVHGVEALLRWRRPDGRLMSAAQFVDLAEDSGLIVPIGAWVLEETCNTAKAWAKVWPQAAELSLHVNLSARQLAEPGLTETVAGILARTRTPPERVVLEITESVLVEESTGVAMTLADLRALGVRIGIDDFGTQYSSLTYLKRLPVNCLKIDRSFVTGLSHDDPADLAIVTAIIGLGNSLGMEVIAEGVETWEQLATLERLGAATIQGYLFARPCDADALAALLRTQPFDTSPLSAPDAR